MESDEEVDANEFSLTGWPSAASVLVYPRLAWGDSFVSGRPEDWLQERPPGAGGRRPIMNSGPKSVCLFSVCSHWRARRWAAHFGLGLETEIESAKRQLCGLSAPVAPPATGHRVSPGRPACAARPREPATRLQDDPMARARAWRGLAE